MDIRFRFLPFFILSSILFYGYAGNLQAAQGLPMDPALFPDDTCRKCHSKPAKVDVTADECAECHTPIDDMGENPPGYTSLPLSGHPKIKPAAEMIRIPGGEFIIGNHGRELAEGRGDPDETPLHSFYVDAFLMDTFEVSNAQYQAFVDETGRRTPIHWKEKRPPAQPGSSFTHPEKWGNHPVVYVSWFDANAYCRWTEKRLPSEEEWEKAARGTDGRIFPWGNQFDTAKANTPQMWFSKDLEGSTRPVGTYENGKSPYGLYDMSGNVYEWTSSWYKPYPKNTEFNGHYGTKNKIVRGGSWYDCLTYGCGLSSPTYNRSRFSPEIRNKGFGFRCAKSLHVN